MDQALDGGHPAIRHEDETMAGRLKAGVVALLAGWTALGPCTVSAEARTDTVRVGAGLRSFSVHVPESRPPNEGFPVVLAFHGGGMQGAGMRRITGLDAVADRRGFIVVYPDAMGRHWNDGRATIRNPQDDVGFVAALLDQVERSYPVDSRRVFATGLSNGALFAERLGCDLSHRIAAIAPVAGSMPTDIAAACRPARAVAVMQVDGTADPIMPYGGGAVEDFGGKGEGGRVMSVAETAAFWAARNGCGAKGAPEPLPPVVPSDPTRVVRMHYTHCPAAGQVTVLSVVDGGHVWPGGSQIPRPAVTGQASRQIAASRAIADFFLSLPEP
jgi:polyhydroxybutyrate depolymerase